jgi:ferrous iron transport protein A
MTLDQLIPGHEAKVLNVTGPRAFRLRLMELGFVPGTVISRVDHVSSIDPLIFRIRSFAVCLRVQEAACVIIEIDGR